MSQSDDLRRLIGEHERRLQVLEEEAGTFGFHTPPHITMEIGNIEAMLRALSARLVENRSFVGGEVISTQVR